MSESYQNTNFLADASSGKVSGGMIDEDKLYESSRTDSGFLSGGNLVLSGEILSEEIIPEHEHRGHSGNDLKTPETQQSLMRLDSGVDVGITESFSTLSLKNPGLNDLNTKTAVQQQPEQHQQQQQQRQLPWEEYYGQDEDGDTYLHMAIVQRFPEVALALIRAAPRPTLLDTPNDDAQSPLHLAVATSQWRIARWLIVAGAKPSPRDIQGDSPLHISARKADIQCCKAITDPVQQQERDTLCLSYPPQPYQPSDLNQWNYEGQTCVHVAAINGHIDVLRHLVWYGADINAREGKSGYTALHYAIEKGDERLIHFLLSECTKLNVQALTYGGRSALQLGYLVPSPLAQVLMSRGVPSPYTSEEDDDDDSDMDDEIYENHSIFHQTNLAINASA